MRHAFSPDGPLARVLEGFEPREGQRRMAEAVASTIDGGGVLLAEAGTGTGKTLAYLIPGILSRRRLLISTGTKNLQEQIFFKDLPALREALGVPFTATLMKGRSNYLCRHRFELYRQSFSAFEPVLLPLVEEWSKTTVTGDRAELHGLPEDLPFWREVAADADTCLGTQCPRHGDCFITTMRQRAAESDVVIVNHHLLCADAAVRQSDYGEVIPACQTLVVDEAHQLEDVATQYFGYAVGNIRIENLVRDGERLVASARQGPADGDARGGGVSARHVEEIARALTRVGDHSRTLFAALSMARAAGAGGEQRARYTAESLADHFEGGMMLAGALEGLEATLAPMPAASGTGSEAPDPGDVHPPPAAGSLQASADLAEALASLQRRAGTLRTDLRFLMRASDPDFVYFLETRGRAIVLRASPINVSRVMRDALFDRMRAAVLTSATLAVDGSFEYVKSRLGLSPNDELQVASEFDYATQALLYLPRRIPPPRAPAFPEAAAREVIEILKRTRGRAFVLFTSYAVLRTVQGFVEMALPYPVLVQGSAPRTELVERFRATPNAVLLATSSFWHGVDVAGEALSCVIVDKLPFASPGDPVTAARIEAINAAGGDAFADYQVPLAILALQQGLGRLIRHRTDRGVLAVLDPRLRTMGYGRRFLGSLPPAPVSHDIGAIERFFV